jgi:hypothetical protein
MPSRPPGRLGDLERRFFVTYRSRRATLTFAAASTNWPGAYAVYGSVTGRARHGRVSADLTRPKSQVAGPLYCKRLNGSRRKALEAEPYGGVGVGPAVGVGDGVGPAVPVGVGGAPVGVGEGVGVGVGPAHPVARQAPQQLDIRPMHAEPFRGARHFAASRLIEHFVTPLAFVRQHVTAPGLPQVDFAAQRRTSPLHWVGSVSLATAALITSFAHFT